MPRRARTAALLAALVALVLPAAAHAGTAPVILGAVQDASNLSATVSVAVSGNIAYTTAYHAGELAAVSYANPASPQIVSGTGAPPLQTNLIGGSNVTIAGGYAFVVSKNRNASTTSNDDGNGNSLTILDVHTNPAVPQVVGTIRDTGRLFGAYGVAVQGNYAYVAYQGLLGGQPSVPDTSKGGFTVIDITNPAGPKIVGNIDDGTLPNNQLNHATSVAISGHYAFVNSFGSQYVSVIDISTPAAPKLVAWVHDPTNLSLVADLAIQGNYLYAADQTGGTSPQFTVLDISSPTKPKVVATISNASILSGAYRIRVHGNFAYLSASNVATVAAIDISDPLHPRIAGYVNSPAYLHTTTGLDVDPTNANGPLVVASSPYEKTPIVETNAVYPPYPLQPGGKTNTGTISVISLDPNPIGVTIAPGSEPANPTLQTSASFTFAPTDDVSTMQCSLDGAAMGPCTSPTSAQYSGLAVGSHTFTVQATDAAGNTASASYSWTVGTVPANTGAPTISDNAPVQGETLTAGNGTWSGVPAPTSYSYQWNSCDNTGNNCAPIPGATSQTYVVQPTDVANTLQVAVTASNGLGSPAPATSPATGVVAGTAPVNNGLPAITGATTVGSQLSASTGSWSNNPTSFTYQWNRCDQSGQNCVPIGAPSSSNAYTLVGADAGSTITVTVTATNTAGQGQASSQPTATVAQAPQNSGVAPSIAGTAAVGSQLTASPGGWTGYPTPSYSYQWNRCDQNGQNCSPIGGSSSSYTVVGADAGSTIAVTVTATNAGGQAQASSQPTAIIAGPPQNSGAAPSIAGTATVGNQLTASPGGWAGYPTPSYSYQWNRCDQNGQNCSAIGGASNTYTLVGADAGSTITVTVTATNTAGQAQASSPPTATVAQAPQNSGVAPSIAGTAAVGSQLTASPGGWTGYPTPSYSYRWNRCDQSGQNCSAIGGASSTYTLVGADAGSTITVTVTATNAGGQAQASSQPTAPVTGAPQNTAAPTISGTAQQGQTLTAAPGSWSAYPAASYSYAWLRCNSVGASCTAISGATAQTYVLVRADVGKDVQVTVTANNGIAPNGTATSAPVGPVVGPPLNTVAPVVSGTATQGQTVTTTMGTWTGYPTPTLRVQWMSCNASGELCSAISGATQTTYTLGTSDVGRTVRSYVYGTNSAGTVLARSNATAVVQAGATGSVVLHLPRSGGAQMTITVRASRGSAAFTRITVAPPRGMSFNVPNSLLSRLVRVVDGSGHRVGFTLARKGSGLLITLRKPERSVKLILGVRVASANLARHDKTSWGIRFKETFSGLKPF